MQCSKQTSPNNEAFNLKPLQLNLTPPFGELLPLYPFIKTSFFFEIYLFLSKICYTPEISKFSIKNQYFRKKIPEF